MSGLYNLILGIALIFGGVFALGLIPGKFFRVLIGLGMMAAGFAVALGYWVIL